MKCTTCGKTLMPSNKFYSACGCSLAHMLCGHCGRQVSLTQRDSDGFGIYRCQNCGTVFEDECRDPRTNPGVKDWSPRRA